MHGVEGPLKSTLCDYHPDKEIEQGETSSLLPLGTLQGIPCPDSHAPLVSLAVPAHEWTL